MASIILINHGLKSAIFGVLLTTKLCIAVFFIFIPLISLELEVKWQPVMLSKPFERTILGLWIGIILG